ncbi:MAG: divergent polysaccharide deacetylase family protein [Ignavibacteriales bacterium]
MNPQPAFDPRRPRSWAAVLMIAGVLALCWWFAGTAARSPGDAVPEPPPPAGVPGGDSGAGPGVGDTAAGPEGAAPEQGAVSQEDTPSQDGDGPMLAIILDDWGFGVPGTKEALELPVPVTMAVLPYGPRSREEADEGRALGHEVILHLPMEPISNGRVGVREGTITVDMDDAEIKQLVERHVDAVRPVSGLNNHTGSRASADPRVARAVVEAAAEKGLFVIDSRTIGNSLLTAVAAQAGVPSAANEVFLDNQKDEEYVRSRLLLAASLARKRGAVIAIGHVHPVTVRAISGLIPEIEEMGVTLVKASRVVESLNVPAMNLADPRLK